MTLEDFDLLDRLEQRKTLKVLLARERARLRRKQGLSEHEGEWTFARPTVPGWYFLADREGNPRGVRQLVVRRTPAGAKLLCEAGVPSHEPGWQGYWFSTPIAFPPAKSEEPS